MGRLIRWPGALLGAGAVAVMVVLVLMLVLSSPGAPPRVGTLTSGRGVPAADPAVTPKGWAPVAYGAAQISVPASWLVTSMLECGRRIPGYVVTGNAATNLIARNPRCRQTPNRAAILLEPGRRKKPGRSPDEINGIGVMPVYLVIPSQPQPVSYYVSSLHALVTASGPLAKRIIATLTRSPQSVVLGPGPRLRVPRSWRWHNFGGIRFAAPGDWGLVRNGRYACPFGLAPKAVVLIPAGNHEMPRCGVHLGTAGLLAAMFGVSAVATTAPGQGTPGFGHCAHVQGLRLCYSAPPFSGGVLDVLASAPEHRRATLLRIGLAGTGLIPRTIVESIRPR
jgi:hypothetical protein